MQTEVLVYIALGSNVDNPVEHVEVAIKELDQLPNTTLLKASSVKQTAPMGPQNQPDYVNAVCQLKTTLLPHELLKCLQALEEKHGRVRIERWGPRTLDLDILLYGEDIIKAPDLTIPHAGIREREFVLAPLAEIAPELVLPTGESIQTLLYNLTHE